MGNKHFEKGGEPDDEKEFKLIDKRKELYKQLKEDLQNSDLSLESTYEDFVEMNDDLDKEFIRLLKEDLDELCFPDLLDRIKKNKIIDKRTGDLK